MTAKHFLTTHSICLSHFKLPSRIKPKHFTLSHSCIITSLIGNDCLPNEVWKLSSPFFLLYITTLFQLCFDNARLPLSWCMARIIPIYKKGPKDDPNNYRPISILSTGLKLYTKILNNRLTEWCRKWSKISDYQAGFRKKRSCADHIFTLMALTQIQLSQGKDLFVAFVDLSQAFDSPNHNLLWKVLLKMGVSAKFLGSLMYLYENASAQVTTATGPTESIRILKGVLQGDSASPTLFNLFIEELVSKLHSSLLRGFRVGKRLIHLLLYADDLALIAQSKELLQEKMTITANFFHSRGLHVNLKKTNVLIFRRSGRVRKDEKFSWRGEEVQNVKSYVYLGVTFQSNGRFNLNSSIAIHNGIAAQGSTLRILKNTKKLVLPAIKTLFCSMVKSTTLYCAGIWGQNHGDALEVVQQKFLKRVLRLPISAPRYFVRMETGSLPLKYDVAKAVWLLFVKLLSSDPESLPFSAYRELRKVSERFPNKDLSWCLQLRESLQSVGLSYLYDRESHLEALEKTPLVFRKLRQSLITADINSAKDSKTYPHYRQIKCSFTPMPFLQSGLPSCLATPVLQVWLNSNSIFNNGSWYNLGYFSDDCKLCGDSLSFFHTMWECPGTSQIRDSLFSNLPSDPIQLISYVSSKATDVSFTVNLKKMFSTILTKFYKQT